MKLQRMQFLTAVTSCTGSTAFLRYPGEAAEFSYKMGSEIQAVEPDHVRMAQAADRIKQASAGRLEIAIYPNGSLGSSVAMVSQMRLGALEFFYTAYNNLESVVPSIGINAVPFAFTNDDQVYNAYAGQFGRYLRSAVADATVGIYPLRAMWGKGFRNVCNSLRPINTASDIKGMKIRITNVPAAIAMWKALGATAVTIPAAEMYTALQTHIVDGVDVNLISVEGFKLYEVQKYESIINSLYQLNAIFASSIAWQRLPSKLRDVVEQEFTASAAQSRVDVARAEQTVRVTLESKGMGFNNADISSLRAAVRNAGLYVNLRGRFGPQVWAMLERSVSAQL